MTYAVHMYGMNKVRRKNGLQRALFRPYMCSDVQIQLCDKLSNVQITHYTLTIPYFKGHWLHLSLKSDAS